jgi:hypothetical protein
MVSRALPPLNGLGGAIETAGRADRDSWESRAVPIQQWWTII